MCIPNTDMIGLEYNGVMTQMRLLGKFYADF